MAYGSLKVDNIIFTNGGVDQTITVSGIVAATSGNLTVTGTVSGDVVQGGTLVSGATVTGGIGQFTTLTGGTAGFTTVTGTTVTGTTAQFTSITGGGIGATTITGTTVSGTTANFASGVFTTQISGATVTGTTANFTSGNFTNISGGTHTITSGVFASGSVTNPSISFVGDSNTGIYASATDQVSITTNGTERLRVDAAGQIESVSLGTAAAPAYSFTTDPNTGIFSPGADQVAISTNGTGRLFVDASGNVGVGTNSPSSLLEVNANVNGSQTPLTITNTGTSGIGLGVVQAFKAYTGSTIEEIGHIRATASTFAYGTYLANATTLTSYKSGGVGIRAADAPIVFYTGNADADFSVERARIDSSGRLGLGTSSPNTKLHVTDGEFTISTGGNTTNAGGIINFGTTALATYSPMATIQGLLASGAGTEQQGGLGFFTRPVGAAGQTLQRRVTISSAGNVGIGTTSPSQPLHVASTGTVARFDSSSSDVLLRLSNSSNGLGYIGYQSSNLTFWVNDTERARIDSSGRLLVGTSTSPSTGDGQYAKLVVQGFAGLTSETPGMLSLQRGEAATSITSGEDLGYITFNDSAGNTFASIQANADANAGSGDYPGRLVFSTTADGASSPTERMRIQNNGGTFLFQAGDGFRSHTSASAGTTFVLFSGLHSATNNQDGTQSFLVYSNGNVLNTNNSYGSLSDIKLKENIVDANSQWNDLKALQIRNYNFKEGQTHTQIGLIAQEVELVSPGLVSESPDRDEDGSDLGTVTKSVNYSVLYMKAVKALQEAMERIETLEADVAALKAS